MYFLVSTKSNLDVFMVLILFEVVCFYLVVVLLFSICTVLQYKMPEYSVSAEISS